MKHALRVATAAAAIAAGGLFAGTAAAAPPLNYDLDILEQFNANNSYETVRHLAVDIGPRRSGLPEEDAAAEFLGQKLAGYGFEPIPGQTQMVFQYPLAGTRPAAKVTSPDTTLVNGPNWQLSFSALSKITKNTSDVTGEVFWVNGGLVATDFPAAASGKIVLMANQATTANRDLQVRNAVAAGAIGVILFGTGQAPPTVTITTAQPNVPVVGGGDLHADELRKALCTGINPDSNPLPAPCAAQNKVTLKLVTNNWGDTTNGYEGLTRAVVVARRKAISDPAGTTAKIVMVGAHIDSVLGAPGAHDDATGNGVSMEIARVVSQFSLDKEIWIGGFGGEEDGLTGSRAWTNQFINPNELATDPPADRASLAAQRKALRDRIVGEWQMDMVGTPYAPARLWALTPDGKSNFVVDEAYKSVARMPASILDPLKAPGIDFNGLQNCRLGQSDHQAFFDNGVPSALFIWLDYRLRAAPLTCESPGNGTYVTEPEYHTPRDGMNNVSTPRMQAMLNLIGSSFAHNAMNRVDVTVRNGSAAVANATVKGNCGDGVRDFGTTDANGYLEVRVPHVTCDFTATTATGAGGVNAFAVSGDRILPITLSSVGGTVPATLSLTLGTPASFGAFTPGVTKTYESATTANVISTAGDATLSVADPSSTATGHLVNGAFSLPQPLQARARNAANTGTAYNNVGSSASPLNLLTYGGPISNDSVALQFSQLINSGDALRTGAYSKTLTFTLSTTTP
jgi:hypothetical protein